MNHSNFLIFPFLTPLNLPKGETSNLYSNQHQSITPLLWRGWGRSKCAGYKLLYIALTT